MIVTDKIVHTYRRIETACIARMAPGSSLGDDGLTYWRVRVLFTILLGGLLLAVLALISGLLLLVAEGLWGLLALEAAFLLIGTGLLLSRSIPYAIRAAVALSLVYSVGLAVVIFVGPLSGGPAWLFAFSVLAAVLLGTRGAVAAVCINGLTLGLIGWLMSMGRFGQEFPFFHSVQAMVAAGVNFTVLSALAAISVSVLVKGLVSTHQKETRLAQALAEEHERLKEAKSRLEREVERHERTGRALRESEERYRALFDRSLDCVFVHDFEGKFLDANEAALALMGYERRDIPSLNFAALLTEDQVPSARKVIQELKETGHQKDITEFRLRKGDGQLLHVESKASVIYRDGNPLAVLGIARDITARKRGEEERAKLQEQLRRSQKLEAVGTLAGGVSHEFNNILGVVLGNAELAMDEMPDGSPSFRNLQEIRIACIRGREVVKQLLSFSRMAEGAPIPVRLDSLIHSSMALLRSTVPPGIEIRTDMADGIGTVLADPSRICEVLIHLCTNAAHAMEDEAGILEIGLSHVDLGEEPSLRYPRMRPGPYVKLSVRDTGIGMPPEVMERIFDPFFTLKAFGKGTGMGLAVVHGIVQNHGAAVFVDSRPGEGSTFDILFPALDEKPLPDVPERGQPGIPSETERILFVDKEKPHGHHGHQQQSDRR